MGCCRRLMTAGQQMMTRQSIYVCALVIFFSRGVSAQEPPAQHVHGGAEMNMAGPLGIGAARDGSGTSWLPDLTPMAAIHGQAGDWALMLHGNAFAQYINESGA